MAMDDLTQRVYDVLHSQWGQRLGLDVSIQTLAERVAKALRVGVGERDEEKS